MGCDIHSVAQVFKDGRWVTVAHEPTGDDRSYDTFAVLANVRNGYGFAGVSTGEGWPYISEPRGLPEGFPLDSDDSERHEDQWMGDHSHSWLLLSEIENFIETKLPKTYIKHGVVTREHWEAIQRGEFATPEEWCGGRSGPDIRVIDEAEAKAGVPSTDVAMSWKVDALEHLSGLRAYVEELRKLAAESKVGPDKVRLVFGFDS
jgi:hypothetical protein